jgi:uncharacterized protein
MAPVLLSDRVAKAKVSHFGALEPIQILILQPTPFCNIDCSYCYLPGRNVKDRMTNDVLERIADEVLRSELFVKETLILWHAGEPCVVPPSWYREASAILQSRVDRPLRFQFQTNGTLIDEEWVRFFAETQSSVTLSIDGPADLHDAHRVDRRGRGTHARVMESVRLLRQGGVNFSTIAVVTARSLDRADDIYDFFSTLQPTSAGFSTEEAEGANRSSSLYRNELLAMTEAFFARLIQRNLRSERPLRIREAEHVLRPIREGASAKVQNQECVLPAMVTIAADGTLAFFSPEHLTTVRGDGSVFAAGNLMTSSFQSLLNSAHIAEIEAQIQSGVEMCRSSCRYFRFCGGGAPANKFGELGRFDATETWHCRVTKQAAVSGILKEIGRDRSSDLRAGAGS